MTEFAVLLLTSAWLGILTSISPCPLASNIAAISFISGKAKNNNNAFLSGFMYSLGRAVIYTLIAFACVKSAEMVPAISTFMQRYMNKVLGGILIISGMFMTNLINVNLPSLTIPDGLQKKLGNGSLAGSFLLGALFTLAMCPVSAAIFFGSLIPLAIKAQSPILMPLIYGLGTGAPVVLFALITVIGVKSVGKFYKNTAKFDKYAQLITGLIFIIVGIYYVLKYIFGIL